MQKFKAYLKKCKPDHNQISTNKYIRIFCSLIHHPNLWHFNRRSIAMAFSVGIMCAWIHVPFHTLIAVGAATILHCNLPLSIDLVWVSNPLTMPLQFYTA